MTAHAVEIRLQTPHDYPALNKLNAESFGPGRFARTAFRVREAAVGDPRLNFCLVHEGGLAGAVQLTPITIGGVEGALLLGPLIVSKKLNGRGYGVVLMHKAMVRAHELGYRLVILVGDAPYYARAGFTVVPAGRIELPGPVDPARLLYAELKSGALDSYRGLVRGASGLPGGHAGK